MDFSQLQATSLIYSSFSGASQVYRGFYNSFPVVLKYLNFPTVESANKAISEFQTQHSLQHPHICSIYGYQHYDSGLSLCLVVESMQCDLSQEVKSRNAHNFPWTESELWEHITALIDALAYAQEAKVTHRDVKPQNIFLTHDKKMKIGDFGSAKVIEFKSAETVIGTPYYLSPELKQRLAKHKRFPPYDPFASDVYSLGLTILYMIRLEERFELSNCRDLSGETEAVISELLVSEVMKGLLRLMLAEKGRPDFVTLRAMFQQSPVPALSDYRAPDSVSLDAVIMKLNGFEDVAGNLKKAFSVGAKIRVSCTYPLCCYVCKRVYLLDIAKAINYAAYYFCGEDCQRKYSEYTQNYGTGVERNAQAAQQLAGMEEAKLRKESTVAASPSRPQSAKEISAFKARPEEIRAKGSLAVSCYNFQVKGSSNDLLPHFKLR